MKTNVYLFTCQHCQKKALAPDGRSNPSGNWINKKISKVSHWFCCDQHYKQFLKLKTQGCCLQCGGKGWIYDGPDRASDCPICVANRIKNEEGENNGNT